MLLIVGIGVMMALGRFWLANLDTDRATLSHQFRVLADPDASARVRLGAIDGMIQARGRQARRALGLLADALNDPDPDVRASAARMIGRLGVQVMADAGPSGEATVRPSAMALLDLIGDPDDDAAAAAIQAVVAVNASGSDGPVVPEGAIADRLRVLLAADRTAGSGGGDARLSAIRAIAAMEPIEGEGPLWFRLALEDPDPKVRHAALVAAKSYGRYRLPEARPPTPGWVFRSLDDPDPDVRMAALYNCYEWVPGRVWERMEPAYSNPEVVAAVLLAGLESIEGDERLSRLGCLAVNDPGAAAQFVPELVEGFARRLDEPHGWRFYVPMLAHIGPPARPALPMLCEVARRTLDDGQGWLTARIARDIAVIGPEAEEAQALLDDLIARWSESGAAFGSRPGLLGKELEDAIIAFGPAARPKAGGIRLFESDSTLGFSAARLLLHIAPEVMAERSAEVESLEE
jgi:hypothetical protein